MRKARLMLMVLVAVGTITSSFYVMTAEAQTIDYNLDYSDPASDVTWTYENGTSEIMSDPKDVNIKWVRSEMQAGNQIIKLTIELASPGAIRTDNATIYQLNIYTNLDNSSHFSVNYTNGHCYLTNNTTASPVLNYSVDFSISGQEIEIFVNISELGNITMFNIDATAETREHDNSTDTWIWKKDFGWEVPGNPGSTPAPPEDTPGFEVWSIVLAAVIAFAVMTVSKKPL